MCSSSKRTVPRMGPRGTPPLTENSDEDFPFRNIHDSLQLRKEKTRPRGSRSQMFFKVGALKNFANFT